jgi:hypothetical protein
VLRGSRGFSGCQIMDLKVPIALGQ